MGGITELHPCTGKTRDRHYRPCAFTSKENDSKCFQCSAHKRPALSSLGQGDSDTPPNPRERTALCALLWKPGGSVTGNSVPRWWALR